MAQQGGWIGASEEDLPTAPEDLPPLPGSKRASLIAEAAAAEAAAVAAAASNAAAISAALEQHGKKKEDTSSRFRK